MRATIGRRHAVVAFSLLLAACGGGGGGNGSGETLRSDLINGHVIDGWVQNAVVCADLNGNGRCDSGDPQARSDATGAFTLQVPHDALATAPLLAEIAAGTAIDGGAAVDASFRLASPSAAYSTDITPLTTIVQLEGGTDIAVAEDLARSAVGLPPYFDIALHAPPAAGTRTRIVEDGIVASLKAATPRDFSDATSLDNVMAAFPPSIATLPTLRIATRDAAPITSREVYLPATFVLDDPAAPTGPVTIAGKIRGRGHSTWGNPKNPYKIQFDKGDPGLAKMADVVGMKWSRNWVVLADWFDRSLLRNKLSYTLGMSSVFRDGLRWGPSAQHVEIWLNGDYIGVYLLSEDIRIAPERVNVKAMSASDIDGGYIVEVDYRLDCFNDGTVNLQHHTPRGVPVCVSKPDEESITQAQLAYIKRTLDDAEGAIFDAGNLDRIDMASFADWYLLQELFRNNDSVFWTSVYLWKDSDGAPNPLDRRLHLGPLWDFDRSAGNDFEHDAWQAEGCWISKTATPWPNWLTQLLAQPEFRKTVLDRWKARRASLERFVNGGIDIYARRIASAQARNFQRWAILGTPGVGYYSFGTWEQEVAFVRQYLVARMAWLDKAYESDASFDALCR